MESEKDDLTALEVISPINNDNIKELQEVLSAAMHGISIARQARGESISNGDIVLEAYSVACGEEVVVAKGTCSRIEIKRPLSELRKDLFNYVSNLAMENV